MLRDFFGEGPIIAPPQATGLLGASLVACPLVWRDPSGDDSGMAAIYRLAYEQAQAALRPSWYERLYRCLPN